MLPLSDRAQALYDQLVAFMDAHVYPAEAVYAEQHGNSDDRWTPPPIIKELKNKAKAEGLWNLFLPESEHGAGLSNYDYAHLCEVMGRSAIAPQIFNCAAPDTGNMEVLARYGTPEQQEQWLKPLLAGEIRSAFCMTEPDVASSDATNMEATARVEVDHELSARGKERVQELRHVPNLASAEDEVVHVAVEDELRGLGLQIAVP